MNHIIIFSEEEFFKELDELYNDEVLYPGNVKDLYLKHKKSTTYRNNDRTE